jgi:hypothetical protein
MIILPQPFINSGSAILRKTFTPLPRKKVVEKYNQKSDKKFAECN